LGKDIDPEKVREAAAQAARTLTACTLIISAQNPVFGTKALARSSGLPLCNLCWDRVPG
jgi:hypothetical protein